MNSNPCGIFLFLFLSKKNLIYISSKGMLEMIEAKEQQVIIFQMAREDGDLLNQIKAAPQ